MRDFACPWPASPAHALTRSDSCSGRSSFERSASSSKVPDHELLRLIGRGSYGEVWLARNMIGTLHAVKVVHRKTFDRDRPYDREFEGIRNFEPISSSHEGFVRILQVGRNDAEEVILLRDGAGGRRERGKWKVGEWASGKAQSATVNNPQAYVPKTLASLQRPPTHSPPAHPLTSPAFHSPSARPRSFHDGGAGELRARRCIGT